MSIENITTAVDNLIALLGAQRLVNLEADNTDLRRVMAEVIEEALQQRPERTETVTDEDVKEALESGDPGAITKAINLELTMVDMGLAFALCNFDHGGTRRDIRKVQPHVEHLKTLIARALPKVEA